jgi:phage shock protein E
MIMKSLGRISVAFALIGLSACMMPDAAERTSAQQKIKEGALVVDVRSPKDFKAGHYTGATNLPLGEVKSRCDQLGDRSRPIVVYCNRGIAAAKAKEQLQAAGFTDVTNAGGLSDLRN